jgi:hypothetical protein
MPRWHSTVLDGTSVAEVRGERMRAKADFAGDRTIGHPRCTLRDIRNETRRTTMSRVFLGSAAAFALALVTATSARAQTAQSTVESPYVYQPRAEQQEVSEPNGALIASGLLTFGVPYLASVSVAAQSQHVGDSRLFIPVAGPWMDLNDRPDMCRGRHTTGCDQDTSDRVMLIANGVLQAAGALQILGGFLFPETRTVTTVAATKVTPEMTITPFSAGVGSYGLGAVGRF